MEITKLQKILSFRSNNDDSSLHSVRLKLATVSKFSEFDCDIGFYPYSNKLNADDFRFLPFEEYIEDVVGEKRSAYAELPDVSGRLFGISLAAVIIVIFSVLNPQDIFSVQSVIAIISAYAIGKELWTDIESFFINTTKNWGIRFKPKKHYYAKETSDSLSRYFDFARNKRYGVEMHLPEKLDFVAQSNSKEVEMCFNAAAVRKNGDKEVRLLDVEFLQDAKSFTEKGYFLIAGLGLISKFLMFSRVIEVFQAYQGGECGIPDAKGMWQKDVAVVRTAWVCGRLKLYGKDNQVKGFRLWG